MAERAFATQRYGDAKQLLDRVLIADPGNSRARLILAELILASGASKAAAEAFGQLLEWPEVKTRALLGSACHRRKAGPSGTTSSLAP